MQTAANAHNALLIIREWCHLVTSMHILVIFPNLQMLTGEEI